MKKILFFLIDFYQKIISAILKNLLGVNKFCRYTPTCSEYAKISIQKKGVLKGSYFSILRILSCQPFFNK
ncbi:MAG: membrane protein insertion efficiency factor YidD [Patescibacteria group bacterium]|nr:membrane protein insertion efficiency factor YidD [Patescibacteria group bacterium]